MSVIDNLIELRKKTGHSQEDVADKLGITRQTYSRIEGNDAPLTTRQLDTLASYFGVPVEEFFYGVQNVDKFKQMYLFAVNQFKKAGIPKTKLAKILYFADFYHYYNNLESMSGVLYRCKEYGPLADAFLEITDVLFETGQIQIECLSLGVQMISIPKQLNNIDFSLLSSDEKKEIKTICARWKDSNVQTIVDYTHKQKPWMSCRTNEVIPYELILQENPDHVF